MFGSVYGTDECSSEGSEEWPHLWILSIPEIVVQTGPKALLPAENTIHKRRDAHSNVLCDFPASSLTNHVPFFSGKQREDVSTRSRNSRRVRKSDGGVVSWSGGNCEAHRWGLLRTGG